MLYIGNIYHQYTPVMLAYIPYMDPMGYNSVQYLNSDPRRATRTEKQLLGHQWTEHLSFSGWAKCFELSGSGKKSWLMFLGTLNYCSGRYLVLGNLRTLWVNQA